MRIAVTGRDGQVAQALLEVGRRTGTEIIALARPSLDLTRPETILASLAAAKPDIVINAAAYTAVDKAEAEPDLAHVVNAQGAGAVAEAARRLGTPVIQISTDFVFDGTGPQPYRETDITGPISVYGRTKLAGERAVMAANDDHCIVRTSWVYGPFASGFVRVMLQLAETRNELRIVTDQYGAPTSALDIAGGLIKVCSNLLARPDDADLRGLFHLAGEGYIDRAGFARRIFAISRRLGGPFASVAEITTADYPTPARRPANSRLDCDRLAVVHGVRLAPWPQSTEIVVARLLALTA